MSQDPAPLSAPGESCLPHALVFDIGRVIVRVNVERALATLGADAGLSAAEVGKAIQADPLMRDFQEGRLAPQQWHRHQARRLGLRLSYERFCAAWNSALDPEPILDADLFSQLGARFRLVLLSNTDPIHVAYMESQFSFIRHFPARIYSCAVGASKPHPAIYQRAIHACRVRPEQILYIDDMADYVEAGRQLGMHALLFRGAEALQEELHRRGILRP